MTSNIGSFKDLENQPSEQFDSYALMSPPSPLHH